MKNLILKNATSLDGSRKVVSSSETVEKGGVRTIVSKRFIYKAIEIDHIPDSRPAPQVFISRICDNLRKQEKFFYRLKASLYAQTRGKMFLILFGHSLRIDSKPLA